MEKRGNMVLMDLLGKLKESAEIEDVIENKLNMEQVNIMSEERPESLEELCDYIVKYCDDIYVREIVDGKWGSYKLTELPPKVMLTNVMRWIKDGECPYRVLSELGNLRKTTKKECSKRIEWIMSDI